MICPTMKNHSILTVQFATQLRSLMSLLQIDTSDEIPVALKRMTIFSTPQDLLQQMTHHLPQNGFFRKFLPLCGCSSNQPDPLLTSILSCTSHEAEANFCFHRKLPKNLYDFYRSVYDHFHAIFKSFGSKELEFFMSLYFPPLDFEKLLKFEICVCVNVAHKRLDFHLSESSDHAFLPAMLVSSRLLSQVFWTPKVLDFSSIGFPESDFEVSF